MSVLSDLQPGKVFEFFEEICSIPHPSYQEERISNYLVEFARTRGLEHYQDDLGNVIIIKEAAPGYEEAEPLILQGHMDMVCEKEPGCDIDFATDGLRLKVEGDYISAEGTTLGGDDGIAIAYALAILDSDDIPHPRLEVICTVSEEVGMEGAAHLDVTPLRGRRLLNLDSEEEGYFLTSCAGGCRADCVLPVSREGAEGARICVSVQGLLGGHSGCEIHRGRGNANVLLGRTLLELSRKYPFRLISMKGGSKDNAIPREAEAELVTSADPEAVLERIAEIGNSIAREFAGADPDIRIGGALASAQSAGGEAQLSADSGSGLIQALTDADTVRALTLLTALPGGVQRMSDDIPGLVETSLNLGILRLEGDTMSLHYAVRSSVGTAKEYLLLQMENLTCQLGGSVSYSGNYPAWEYRRDSKLRSDMVRIFTEMYGREPKIEAIHAGLECGILSGKLPDLDCVSIGPDMEAVHTAQERLSISSVARVWEFLLAVLACK